MKQILLAAFIIINCSFIAPAQNFSMKDFKQLNWITGSWKMTVKNGSLYEQWHVLNDSTLQNKGFIVKAKGDTVILESVQIALRDNKLFYIPTAFGQNNNEPVTFTFTAASAASFTAENLLHDFPQKIYYKSQGDKGMYAEVSGKEKSVLRKETFNYVKE